jgi:hypothetical protein
LTNNIKCPKCKSDKVIPIVYGTPSVEILEAEKWGELEIAECEFVDGVSPNRRCLTCGHTWFEPEDIYA